MIVKESIKRRSICSVKAPDFKGKRCIIRLADIDEKGRIISHDFKKDQPMVFDNRNRIFCKDGPTKEGFIGVWDWTAIPNLNDGDKDYIESHFDSSESPIAIIKVSKAYSLEDLVNYLKTGITADILTGRTMFTCRLLDGSYEAVLCDIEELDVEDGSVKLKSSVASLDVYTFDDNEIYKGKNIEFYKYMKVGEPKRKELIKSYMDIIKEIILQHASWSVAKQNGLSKADWKLFKDFIGNVTNDSMYVEIAEVCGCGKEEAQKIVNDFIESANSLIDEGDIDDEILAGIVKKNDALRKSYEKLVEENWKAKNQKKIKEKTEELEKILKDISESELQKKKIDSDIENEKKKLEKFLADIAQYDNLENSIKEKVQIKIEEARKDAADFLSELVMFSPVTSNVNQTIVTLPASDEIFYEGVECADGESTNYQQAIESITDELGETGVEGRYITSLATYIFSAYINHAHLLIAGPNAESIANAFSIGMFGRYPGVLDCGNKYSKMAIDAISNTVNEVVIIKSAFATAWRDAVMSLLSEKNKFFILICPYAEDLVIEPKGLFNYVLPLFTETVVVDYPQNKFVGKKLAANYENYERCKKKPLYSALLRKVNANMLLTNKMQQVLTDLHYLDKNADSVVDYMYLLFPYAYIAGCGDAIAEALKSKNMADIDKVEFMIKYLGEEE